MTHFFKTVFLLSFVLHTTFNERSAKMKSIVFLKVYPSLEGITVPLSQSFERAYHSIKKREKVKANNEIGFLVNSTKQSCLLSLNYHKVCFLSVVSLQ